MAIPIQIKTYKSFGGLRQDIAEANNGPENALISKNVRFLVSDEGRFRDGYSFFNTSTPVNLPKVSTPILGIHQFKHEGASDLLVAAGEYVYIDDGTSVAGSLTVVKSGQGSDNKYSFCNLNDQCYIVNNDDDNIKFDGDNVSDMCIEAPDMSAGSVAYVGTGSVFAVGTYGYLFTYVNNHGAPGDYSPTYGQESNPETLTDTNFPTITLTSTATSLSISGIPTSTDPQVSHVNIYRTTVNGSIYDAQYSGQVTNGTSTYSDTTADSDLGDSIQLFHSIPPTFKKILVHKNKIFAFEENSTNLWYSYDYNGWYWPQGEFGGLDFRVQVNKDDGDYIKNIVSYVNGLLIFKENSVWVLEGYDESDFFLRQIDYNEHIGCVGINGAINVNNNIYFVDKKGIYVTDGNSFQNISSPVINHFNNKNLLYGSAIDRNKIDDCSIGIDTYNNNKVIKFSFTSIEGSSNDTHLIFDYQLNKWSLDAGYIAECYAKYDNDNIEYLLRGDDIGYLFSESTATYDGAYETGLVSDITASELTADGVSWDTNEFRGCYVVVTSGKYKDVVRRIVSNDGDTLTVDETYGGSGIGETYPSFIIGSSDYLYFSGWDDYGVPGKSKRLKFIRPRLKTTKDVGVDIFNLYDFVFTLSSFRSISVENEVVYGSDRAIWDTTVWGAVPIQDILKDTQVDKVHTYHCYGLRCYDITSELVFNNYDKCVQIKGISKR